MTGPLYLLIPGSALCHEQNLITILSLAVVIYQQHTLRIGKHSRCKAINHTEIRCDGGDNGVCVCTPMDALQFHWFCLKIRPLWNSVILHFTAIMDSAEESIDICTQTHIQSETSSVPHLEWKIKQKLTLTLKAGYVPVKQSTHHLFSMLIQATKCTKSCSKVKEIWP